MKQISRIVSVFLAVIMITLIMPSASLKVDASTDTITKRLGGNNRIETAISIANEGWDRADTVIIANGYNFADALAGVPLAAVLDAPILLSNADSLPASVLSEIRALGANKVIMLGGHSALNINVESSLSAAGLSVTRISGQSRYETSTAIAEHMKRIVGDPSEVFVASGVNFADALSISPIAGSMGCPVIYAPKTGGIDSSADNFLRSVNCTRITVLGGEAAVHPQTEHHLKSYCDNVMRISGPDRYKTAQAICEYFNSKLTGNGIAFATGSNFPDALAGGVFAAKNKIPVVLVSNGMVNTEASGVFNLRSPSIAYIFGGQSAVDDQTVDRITSGNSTTTTTTTATTTTATTTAIPTTTSTSATTTTTQPTTAPSRTKINVYVGNSQNWLELENGTRYGGLANQKTDLHVKVTNPPARKYSVTCEVDNEYYTLVAIGSYSNNVFTFELHPQRTGLVNVRVYLTENPEVTTSFLFNSVRSFPLPDYEITNKNELERYINNNAPEFPVYIKNNGTQKLRLYSAFSAASENYYIMGANRYDEPYYSYRRLNCVDIPAGEEYYVVFRTDNPYVSTNDTNFLISCQYAGQEYTLAYSFGMYGQYDAIWDYISNDYVSGGFFQRKITLFSD